MQKARTRVGGERPIEIRISRTNLKSAIVTEGGFGHNIAAGDFNPIFYTDCCLLEPEGISFGIDVNILHEGAVIAVLCKLSDFWDENGDLPDDKFVSEVRRILSEGRLDHLPLAERAVKEAFRDEESFRDALDEVYENYVVQRFRKLAGG
jgi:hypothetical protein